MKRILILSSDNILSASIQRLLTQELGYDPEHISLEEDISRLQDTELQQIGVIIMNESKVKSEMNILLKLLQLSRELKLICINAEDNLALVFDKQQVVIRSTADLSAAIGRP